MCELEAGNFTFGRIRTYDQSLCPRNTAFQVSTSGEGHNAIQFAMNDEDSSGFRDGLVEVVKVEGC